MSMADYILWEEGQNFIPLNRQSVIDTFPQTMKASKSTIGHGFYVKLDFLDNLQILRPKNSKKTYQYYLKSIHIIKGMEIWLKKSSLT